MQLILRTTVCFITLVAAHFFLCTAGNSLGGEPRVGHQCFNQKSQTKVTVFFKLVAKSARGRRMKERTPFIQI